jgi:hypothetical protein
LRSRPEQARLTPLQPVDAAAFDAHEQMKEAGLGRTHVDAAAAAGGWGRADRAAIDDTSADRIAARSPSASPTTSSCPPAAAAFKRASLFRQHGA